MVTRTAASASAAPPVRHRIKGESLLPQTKEAHGNVKEMAQKAKEQRERDKEHREKELKTSPVKPHGEAKMDTADAGAAETPVVRPSLSIFSSYLNVLVELCLSA